MSVRLVLLLTKAFRGGCSLVLVMFVSGKNWSANVAVLVEDVELRKSVIIDSSSWVYYLNVVVSRVIM